MSFSECNPTGREGISVPLSPNHCLEQFDFDFLRSELISAGLDKTGFTTDLEKHNNHICSLGLWLVWGWLGIFHLDYSPGRVQSGLWPSGLELAPWPLRTGLLCIWCSVSSVLLTLSFKLLTLVQARPGHLWSSGLTRSLQPHQAPAQLSHLLHPECHPSPSLLLSP